MLRRLVLLLVAIALIGLPVRFAHAAHVGAAVHAHGTAGHPDGTAHGHRSADPVQTPAHGLSAAQCALACACAPVATPALPTPSRMATLRRRPPGISGGEGLGFDRLERPPRALG